MANPLQHITTHPDWNSDTGGFYADSGTFFSDGSGNVTVTSVTQKGIFNVATFGAIGDGVTDCTMAIQNAINAAAGGVTDGTNTVGGTVVFPAGTYLTNKLTIFNYIHLRGAGITATTIKLINGANADLIYGSTAASFINLAAAQNTSPRTAGANNWGLYDLTLDGNLAGQTVGPSYCVRVYGYGYIVQNVRMKNGYSGGVLVDWNGASGTTGDDSMEAQWSKVKIHDCNGIGLEIGGPHDSNFSQMIVYNTGSHGIHIAPNAVALVFSDCHVWHPTGGVNAVAWLIESSSCEFTNCEAEGSDVCQVVLLGNTTNWIGGRIFGTSAGTNIVGIQMGQNAGGTPYPGSLTQSGGLTTVVNVSGCLISTIFTECRSGAISFVNEGHNIIQASVFQASGVVLAGNPSVNDTLVFNTNGITPDGTQGLSGLNRIFSGSNNAFEIRAASNNLTYMNVNTNASPKKFELPNGIILRQYSDNSVTRSVELSSGTISLFQSATAAVIATSGTITTSGVGVARVAPTGAVTGIILQAGTNAGQMVHVINESAFSVTFAVSGTSNVAQGTSAVVPANGRLSFCWDSATNLWY